MARLTAAARAAEPASVFAGPDRSFPIPDVGHAKAALREIGHAAPGARAKIRARADSMLGRKKHGPQGLRIGNRAYGDETGDDS